MEILEMKITVIRINSLMDGFTCAIERTEEWMKYRMEVLNLSNQRKIVWKKKSKAEGFRDMWDYDKRSNTCHLSSR